MKYQCKYCSFECEQSNGYLKHMRIHQDEKDFVLKCESCHKLCKSVAAYKKHQYWHQMKDERDSTRSAESLLHYGGSSHQASSGFVRDRSPCNTQFVANLVCFMSGKAGECNDFILRA